MGPGSSFPRPLLRLPEQVSEARRSWSPGLAGECRRLDGLDLGKQGDWQSQYVRLERCVFGENSAKFLSDKQSSSSYFTSEILCLFALCKSKIISHFLSRRPPFKVNLLKDFSRGPVVKILRSQGRGLGLNPWSGS